ncbi:ABC transporter substrate-binding protein [Moraxella caviae]|uniref:ABC transporter arginine-binding protein 1 n=1 Tax=Moraxella caviae TaxID=34060 RepID=A0A1T0A5H0_9GAMM|nr:transporter substrate-binding domain-containing protein [Moraxella caviae]OOR90819.1 ABC transporter substrate-binding protein [Moraxella caviae]STZ10647.1 ABC transporter arginine-binding protein 1 precursor [Moraxella caviae]VEW10554.1 ABC transporter arginine-binding protein 1 precursor [Moraxella caviae]
MKHTLKFAAAAAFALSLSACGGDKPAETAAATDTGERTLRIATEAAYPPFNDTSPDGKIIGFDVDVMNALCEEMKAKCEIVAQDWDGLIPGLLANKYDAIIAGMSITEERLQQVDFTEPYFANTIVWLAKNDGSFDPNNISNSVLGGQRSTTGAAYITEKYDGKDGNRVQLYDTYTNAYLDMKAGRNVAVMAEKVSASDWLKQNNEGFGLVGEEIDNNDNIGIAVRKGDALKAEFDAALAAIKANGTLEKIEQANFSN